MLYLYRISFLSILMEQTYRHFPESVQSISELPYGHLPSHDIMIAILHWIFSHNREQVRVVYGITGTILCSSSNICTSVYTQSISIPCRLGMYFNACKILGNTSTFLKSATDISFLEPHISTGNEWPSSGESYKLFKEATIPTTDPLCFSTNLIMYVSCK
jgi:hypothetical protein